MKPFLLLLNKLGPTGDLEPSLAFTANLSIDLYKLVEHYLEEAASHQPLGFYCHLCTYNAHQLPDICL